jgi:hypothetical protein
MGCVAFVEETKKKKKRAYNISVGRDHFRDLGMAGRIILK